MPIFGVKAGDFVKMRLAGEKPWGKVEEAGCK